jgi:hypothetical protein
MLKSKMLEPNIHVICAQPNLFLKYIFCLRKTKVNQGKIIPIILIPILLPASYKENIPSFVEIKLQIE